MSTVTWMEEWPICSFNVYGADLETVQFCCTSGHCDGCRDSQAVHTWLLVSIRHFLNSRERLATWIELAETYWRQFIWSPYARSEPTGAEGTPVTTGP